MDWEVGFKSSTMRKSTIYIPIRNPFKGDLSEQSYIDVLEIREDIIKESISDVFPTPHEGKSITRHNGVEYLNDSGSVTVVSSAETLKKIDKPIIWIAGEMDDAQDYSKLNDLVNKNVKAIICITKSKNNEAFKVFAGNQVQLIVNVTSISEAVKIAFYLAVEGDIVLYSPASSIIDEGKSMKERSAIYNAVVERLKTMAY